METIAAIATGSAKSAISIIRVSGDDAIPIVDRLFTKDITDVPSHTVHYGFVVDPLTKETIDEVLVIVFRAPKTFTREDVVEIHCHGGLYVTRHILTLVLGAGARLAEPGEFTRRAFLNGRLDLTQAEAIGDMLDASDHGQMVLAAQGIKGSVRRLIDPFLEDLVQIISNIEVNIDYPEYDDVQILTEETLLPQVTKWLKDIDRILTQAKSGQVMKEGIVTAIIGKPNVGKSSLLNALLEENKAIVTDIAGTTRDIVEGDVRLVNVTLHMLDTAGIRESEDPIEQIGIQKSKQALDQAQLVLVVLDGSKPLDERDEALLKASEMKDRFIVCNKADLGLCHHDGIAISAKDGSIEPLVQAIEARYAIHQEALQQPILANARQIGLMMQAKDAMQRALEALQNQVELDLVTIDLQTCYRCMMEIIGGYSKEGLLDEIFSRFCLGK